MVSSPENDLLRDSNLKTIQGPGGKAHLILWLSVIFILVSLLWASLAQLDEVTRADGKVIPSRQVQIIQNLEGGILNKILVKEGEVVEKNQILMHIDDTRFSSSFRESHLTKNALLLRVARLTAEAQDKAFLISHGIKKESPELSASELSLYHARQRELESKMRLLDNQLEQKNHELNEMKAKQHQIKTSYSLVAKEMSMTEPLVLEGAVSKVELLRVQRVANDLAGELETTKHAIPRIQSELKGIETKKSEVKNAYLTEVSNELNEAKSELSRVSETNVALQDRVNRTAVRTPVRGTVKDIHINTVGGVIQPGMELIEVVPLDDTLLVEARVRPADIAFIHPGQSAMVKITAYDFAIYGGLKGQVEHISADTIEDEEGHSFYEIRVRTDKNFLGAPKKPLPIIPGMTATVDILTGKKSVLDYLLKPILRAKHTALRER